MTSNTSVNNAAVANTGASNIDDILISGNATPTITANPTSQTITGGSTGSSSITITDETPATVTLSGSSNNTTLVPNSGIAFTGTGATRTLTVTPAAGQSGTATITVTATDAGNLTGTVTYILTVNAPTIAVAPSTLPSGLTGTAYNSTIMASGGTTPYSFAVTAGALPTGLTLAGDGTLSGTPTAAGTFSFTITATDANNFTGSRSYTVTINAAQPGTLSFSAATYSVTEGDGTATITVTRTGGTDGAVSATYATSNGTATAGTCGATGADYQATSGTVSFAAGSATSQTFTVSVCADAIYEDAETVNLTLSGANVGGQATAILTVNDNNAQPAFKVSNVSKNEGDSGTTSFTFTISKDGATALPSSVTYRTIDGTATEPGDYTALPATVLNFLPSDESFQVTVLVNGDTTPEPNETFFVNLSNATGGTIFGSGNGTGTIINDEPSETTLAAPQDCVGLAPSPLVAGSTNKALLCFALSSNTNANFTALNVPFTRDPSVRFSNPRLIKSTDADYTTTGDNVEVSIGSVSSTPMQFTFSGFSAFADAGKGGFPSLTATPTNFFVVADVLPGVSASTLSSQPSVSTGDITVSNGTVTGTTATGQNYTFTLGTTAADGVISGRVVNTNHRGLENVTVTLAGGSLVAPIVVYTDQRGRYSFTEVPTGAIYTITVASKRHTFNQPSTALDLTGNSENINFVGEGW